MIAPASKPRKTQKKFATVWSELEYLCGKIHHWLYERCDKSSAKRFQSRLSEVLTKLPENDLAILREEGLALLHELKSEIAQAIRHRKKEIRLIERLHDSVKKSVDSREYDAEMGASILANRDATILQKRRDILTALKADEALKKSNPKPSRKTHASVARHSSSLPKGRPSRQKRPA